ncbi:AAA family ATPase [Sphingobacterium griseoflavum]|uniref:ATPase n=1 Tax=Sphingobacterium griseoflavum TaxID=1474952 RepID=A0ABQ3HW86_9SPHI|nr:AAA family ATPase [Sphingobacterium griseoflavum]GHE32097.1 ATPase [Sphingobacterium griseoflavum]
MDNFYVITGGPGVGKTTLLHELGKSGFRTVAEDARRIIQDEIKNDGDGVPWKNKAYYTVLMLQASVEQYVLYRDSDDREIHFFDRGILDACCYAEMMHIDMPDDVQYAAARLRYNRKVFILPPWKEIYKHDEERRQDWREAVYTYEAIQSTYRTHGYELIEVPKESVQHRVDFVVSQIRG